MSNPATSTSTTNTSGSQAGSTSGVTSNQSVGSSDTNTTGSSNSTSNTTTGANTNTNQVTGQTGTTTNAASGDLSNLMATLNQSLGGLSNFSSAFGAQNNAVGTTINNANKSGTNTLIDQLGGGVANPALLARDLTTQGQQSSLALGTQLQSQTAGEALNAQSSTLNPVASLLSGNTSSTGTGISSGSGTSTGTSGTTTGSNTSGSSQTTSLEDQLKQLFESSSGQSSGTSNTTTTPSLFSLLFG